MIARALLMARKDLLRRSRSPLSLLPGLLFPVLFALLLGVTFGGREPRVPKIRLLVENRDDGLVSSLLMSSLDREEMTKYVDSRQVAKGEGAPLMERGEASALLIVPEKFSSRFIDGEPVALQLVRNPAEGILPEAAEELARTLAEVLSTASRVLREPLERLSPLIDADAAPEDLVVADLSVAFSHALQGVRRFAAPLAITMEVVPAEAVASPVAGADTGTAAGAGKTAGTGASTAAGTAKTSGSGPDDEGVASIFLLILPGISVFSLFMFADQSMRDILTEGTLGTLRRQMCGPVRAGTIVAGKAIATGVGSLVMLLILSVIGWLVSPRHVSLAGFAALSVSLVLAATGFVALVYAAARTERQGSGFTSLAGVFMGTLGGSFIPYDSLPATMQKLAPLSLYYWGTSGFRKLLFDGAGLAGVGREAAVLAIAGAVLLSLGALLLRRKVRVQA